MMSCIATPSAWENSRTVTPDGTVTGPVGGDDLARLLRARRGALVARAPPVAGAGAPRRCRSRRGACGPAGAAAGLTRSDWACFGPSAIGSSV